MGDQVRRSQVTIRDPAEGLAVMEEVYAVRGARRAADTEFLMTLSTAGAGPVSLQRSRWQGIPASGVGQHPGVLRVGQVLQGTLSVTSGRDELSCRGPFLLPRRPYASSWEDLDVLTVSLEAAAVEDHARALRGSEAFRLEFTGTGPVSPAMGRYWQATIAHVGRDLLPHDQLMSNPLLRAEIARSVITSLLHTFPNTALDPGPAPGGPHAVPAAVRRAVAFIDAHLDEDIGLAEIAAAARMSPRGLQAAFRRDRGTTPLGYLRAARLESAHRDLLAADPASGMSVVTVAARWGFAHPGRFAAAYRARYGRAPSDTLRS